MDVPNFDLLAARVFDHYNAKEYEEALELVTEQAPHFPHERDTLALWRACLAARTDQASLAIWILEEALATGAWWAPERLREDPDFASVKDAPDFIRLVEICAKRQADAAARAVPAMLVARPGGTPPWPALVALHGAGSNAGDSLPEWHSAVGAGWLLAMPQSVEPSGPGWFRWNSDDASMAAIKDHISSIKDLASRVVIGGFSAGGRVALEAAITGAIDAAGVVAVAAAHVDVRSLEAHLDGAASRGVRIYLLAGAKDVGGSEWSRALAASCDRHGVVCTLDLRPDDAHVYPADFDTTLPKALAFCSGA